MDDNHDYGGWLTEDLKAHYKELIRSRDRREMYSERAELNKMMLIYNKMYLGMNNPELQMQFLRSAVDKGSRPFGKITQKDIRNIMYGNKTISDFGFFRGGIASLLE